MKKAPTSASILQDAIATSEALFSLGQSESQAIAAEMESESRVEFARRLCSAVLVSLWKKRAEAARCNRVIRKSVVDPIKGYSGLVERLAEALSSLSNARDGFLFGQLYTALLPKDLRKNLGAYYTPPPLVNRLLDLATQRGVDWKTARVIDPACGGAAFLASVAPKLLAAGIKSPVAALEDIERRLVGLEIDPFAAWMSMVLLDITLIDLSVAAGRPLKPVVITGDAFKANLLELGKFDLIIGNPPYGRVTLEEDQRERFKESLFGHANLYGLFTELAVRLAKPNAFIAFVTPTSFLGGEYFKKLRKFLTESAPLQKLDFVSNRDGVFDGVLQETMLAVFKRQIVPKRRSIEISLLHAEEATTPVSVEVLGEVVLPNNDGSPWLLPRSRSQALLIQQFASMPYRLADFGFAISTGQLVWNRHKEQLRATFEEDLYPIIWAEAISADGAFHFQAARRTHLPYLKLEDRQSFLINQEPCVLVQRTTSKEQHRRLIAAVIPNSFVMEYPGFVVENHLNMIYSLAPKPQIALRTIAALLNSHTVDQAFRCVNGSVAVSAYELNSLPMPSPEQMKHLQKLVLSGASSSSIETKIAEFYSALNEYNGTAATHSRNNDRKVAA